MKHLTFSLIALTSAFALGFAQDGRSVVPPPDHEKVFATAKSALNVLGLEPSLGTIQPTATNKSQVFVFYKHSNMLVDHVRSMVVYASNEPLRKEIERRPSGQATIKRSDAKWSEMGLDVARRLWPKAKLTLHKATRYPDEPRNRITGEGSPRSLCINLEYRGTVGSWEVRADVVFDQVTGQVTVVRMGDLPKPR